MTGVADRDRAQLSVLLLCDDRPSHAPNVLEHIRALQRFSRHRVDTFNPHGVGRSRVLRLGAYDVVVIHYTIFVLSDNYLAPWFREQVAAFEGLKVQFIQDEYRQVDAVAERARELGINVLFSSVPAEAVPDVYGPRLPGVDVVCTLTGYVPADLERRPRPPLAGRPLDVVYRGRSIPYWLGRLGQEKILIGREFLERAASTDLRCDIAWTEAERIYGEEWYGFLGSSRTTLGTESGASIVDFDGSLQARTDDYLRAHPAATFEEVERELLAPFEGNAVIQTISPRVFEAAALGTAMVNFTGRYSDAIEPWTHYVPLEKDFSNFEEVVSAVSDDAVLEPIAARAHADLVASGDYSLRRFVEGFDREIETRTRPTTRGRRRRGVRASTQALLALEQFAGPSRRAELALVGSMRTRALDRAERSLIRRFPEIEALLEAEPDEAARQKLRADAVRLAAAAAAHVRELRYIGRPFDVQLELSADDRRLTLVGSTQSAPDADVRREIGERVTAAIQEGRLEEIVWNNSAVGSLTFFTFPISRLEIGYHIIGAAHRFTALAVLARRRPESVISALQPLFRRRPDTPVHELDRRTALLAEAVSKPGPTAARGLASARATLGSTELRRLLRAYLRSPEARAEAPVQVLLKDLFRLKLVGESRTSAELAGHGRRLVYRTPPNDSQNGDAIDPATVRALEQIVWDHSAAGNSVTSKSRPRISVTLDEGIHEFRALTLVARRFPELAAPALERAARSR
jgi:hypothetical protein